MSSIRYIKSIIFLVSFTVTDRCQFSWRHNEKYMYKRSIGSNIYIYISIKPYWCNIYVPESRCFFHGIAPKHISSWYANENKYCGDYRHLWRILQQTSSARMKPYILDPLCHKHYDTSRYRSIKIRMYKTNIANPSSKPCPLGNFELKNEGSHITTPLFCVCSFGR